METTESMDAWSETSGPLQEERKSSRAKAFTKFALLPLMFLIAMVLGIAIGFIIRAVDPEFTYDERKVMYLGFPGEIMINMLKGVILPLVITSMIAGVGALPGKSAGKLGGRMIAYYMSTTLVAVIIGIVFVCSIQPGNIGDDDIPKVARGTRTHPVDSLLDLIRNLFPNNLVIACFNQFKTNAVGGEVVSWVTAQIVYSDGNVTLTNMTLDAFHVMNETLMNETLSSAANVSITIEDTMAVKTPEELSVSMSGGTNTLGLIVFSIVFGLMISHMQDRGKPLLQFFELMQEGIIRVVQVIIWYCPIGILFLLAAKIVGMVDPAKSFMQLGWYMLTVILGLGTHFFLVLPLLYLALTRRNPLRLLGNVSPALMLAITTASSSATMPVTLKCLRERAGVNPLVSNFMIPVGATINMDGTALYEAVASIWIAQYNDITLDIGQIIIISITATAAAIGAAGVPEGGLVTMLIVLTAVGLPTGDIGLIYAVDWMLDRLRTCTNVWGDSIGAAIVAHRMRDELEMQEQEGKKSPDIKVPPPYTRGPYIVANDGIISISRL